MTARRELRLAVLLCLVGSALVLLAASRTWLALMTPAQPPLPASVRRFAGSDLVPGVRVLAVLGLAGVAALLAARRWGKIAVGFALAAAGAAVVVLDARVLADPAGAVTRAASLRQEGISFVGTPHLGPWPLGCLAGGVLLGVAGLLVVVRGRRWAALSARYERPAGRAEVAAPVGDKGVWDALDRGEDPTGPW